MKLENVRWICCSFFFLLIFTMREKASCCCKKWDQKETLRTLVFFTGCNYSCSHILSSPFSFSPSCSSSAAYSPPSFFFLLIFLLLFSYFSPPFLIIIFFFFLFFVIYFFFTIRPHTSFLIHYFSWFFPVFLEFLCNFLAILTWVEKYCKKIWTQ